jgi:hypothetical protein
MHALIIALVCESLFHFWLFQIISPFQLSSDSPGTMDIRPRVAGLTATFTFILMIGSSFSWPSRRHDLLDDEDVKVVHHRSYVSLSLKLRLLAC